MGRSLAVFGSTLIVPYVVACSAADGSGEENAYAGMSMIGMTAAISASVEISDHQAEFVISDANGPVQTIVAPLEIRRSNDASSQFGAYVATALALVESGNYFVDARLIDADAQTFTRCSSDRSQAVSIEPAATQSLEFLPTCSNAPEAKLSSIPELTSPSIRGLSYRPRKSICRGELARFDANANDDPNLLQWDWSVAALAPSANDASYCLSSSGSSAAFSASKPGRYVLHAQVSNDEGSTLLSFPVQVDECTVERECAEDHLEGDIVSAGHCTCGQETGGVVIVIDFGP